MDFTVAVSDFIFIDLNNFLNEQLVGRILENKFFDYFSIENSRKKVFESLFILIKDRYNEPARKYHRFSHILKMYGYIDRYSSKIENHKELLLACLYHDIVYESKERDNEEKSALVFQNDHGIYNLSQSSVELVNQLILSTKKHFYYQNTFECKLFLDADLSILGTDRTQYTHYMEAIREEYNWVDDVTYKRERSRILTDFLKRDSIFFTDEMKEEFEEKARENLAYELQILAPATST